MLHIRSVILRSKVILSVCCMPFQVESSDLIAYGLIPEFVGRFPILVNLSALTEDQLVEVILPLNMIIIFYSDLIQMEM